MFAFAVLFLSIIMALDAWFGEISKTLLRERFLDGVLTPSMAFLVSHAATIAVLQSNANTLALAAEAGGACGWPDSCIVSKGICDYSDRCY